MSYSLNLNSNLSENVEYSSPVLPIKAKHCRQSWYANKKAPLHWHSDIECIYVIEGSMTYYVNDMTYELKQGQGIFVNANRMHFCQCRQDEDCYYMVLLLCPSCLAINPKVETLYINSVIFNSTLDAIVLQPEGWQQDFMLLMQKIFNRMQNNYRQCALSVMQDVFCFWDILYQNTLSAKYTNTSATDMDSLKEMITFIHFHYKEKLSLSDIAASGTMCESKCCCLFKAAVHQSPMAYLNTYRIRVSLGILSNTYRSITDIALSCGFNSGSYYTETFRKIMNTSPREYRKTHPPGTRY